MHLGALSSLAEVGIGVNLAFSVVRHLRVWLEGRVQTGVTSSTGSIGGALAELGHDMGSAVQHIAEIAPRFKKRAAYVQAGFIAFAVVASFLLTALLAYLSVHGTDECSPWILVPVLLLVAGPTCLWMLALVLDYGLIRLRLGWTLFRCKWSIKNIQEFTSRSVNPPDPDDEVPTIPPPPP